MEINITTSIKVKRIFNFCLTAIAGTKGEAVDASITDQSILGVEAACVTARVKGTASSAIAFKIRLEY